MTSIVRIRARLARGALLVFAIAVGTAAPIRSAELESVRRSFDTCLQKEFDTAKDCIGSYCYRIRGLTPSNNFALAVEQSRRSLAGAWSCIEGMGMTAGADLVINQIQPFAYRKNENGGNEVDVGISIFGSKGDEPIACQLRARTTTTVYNGKPDASTANVFDCFKSVPGILSTGSATEFNHVGGTERQCIADYLRNLESENRDSSCKGAIKEMLDRAQNNVKKLTCEVNADGHFYRHDGNATFVSKRVFVTAAHLLHKQSSSNDANPIGPRFSSDELRTCSFGDAPEANAKIIPEFVRDGSPERSRKDTMDYLFLDYLVGVSSDTTGASESLPIISSDEVSLGDELWSVAAFDSYATTRACFSVSVCKNVNGAIEPDVDAKGGTPIHIHGCSTGYGSAGAAVFALRKNQEGKCTGFGLVAISEGGLRLAPAGSPFYYPPANENRDSGKAMWSSAFGMDGGLLLSIGGAKRNAESLK